MFVTAATSIVLKQPLRFRFHIWSKKIGCRLNPAESTKSILLSLPTTDILYSLPIQPAFCEHFEHFSFICFITSSETSLEKLLP